MSDDDLPPAVRKHPELATLLKYADSSPEARAAVMQFLRSCEHLTREELHDVFEHGIRFLREQYPEHFR